MENENPHASRRNEKAPFVTIGLLGALAFGLLLWWTNATAAPRLTIPTPTLPSPNAHDLYVRAGKAVVRDRDISYAVDPKTRAGKTYTWADKADLVRANAAPLKTLRQGFAFPYHAPPARSFNHPFPYHADFRGIVRLLSLEGQVKTRGGDNAGAMNSYLDAIQLGQTMPRGGVLIGGLVGIACQIIGREHAWELAPKLSASEAKAATRRMETILARHVPFADVMREEKWLGQAALLEMFRNPGSLVGFIGPGRPGSASSRAATALSPLFYVVYPKRRIMADYSAYMDKIVANARLPYATKPPTPPLPSDPLNRILLPVFNRARIKDVNSSETQNALLTVALALRAFRAETGAYPAALAQLVPAGGLSRVPDDPFALFGPLRYKQTKMGYVLYSVGPDGRDDNGKAINDPGKIGSARRYVNDSSRGDIVAGVNVY